MGYKFECVVYITPVIAFVNNAEGMESGVEMVLSSVEADLSHVFVILSDFFGT